VRVLAASQDHWQQVYWLLKRAGGSGNLVTDAQLGALAVEYRGTVHTADTDFQRFPGVSWFNPITGAKGKAGSERQEAECKMKKFFAC
jgi:uncharacterized protein